MKTKLVIFGISGDLGRHKLLPALEHIVAAGYGDDVEIIGVSRHNIGVSQLVRVASNLIERTRIFMMNLADPAEYGRLREHINLRPEEQVIVYLSVPPSASAQIAEYMGRAGINTPNVKMLFEKPFGVDLVSAEEVIEQIAQYYDEQQIYRVDHYLAKEMAQNIITFRSSNALFSHIWHRHVIQSVHIVASETIGIEGRAQFYEQTGALRDIVQGHLLQLLALVLLDIPAEFDWQDLPRLRYEALAQLRPADPALCVRGQYDTYRAEVNNPKSDTETYVSLQLESRDERWKNIPLTLTTGKALKTRTTEIHVCLRKAHTAQCDEIIFHIQPDEGISIQLYTKRPGYSSELEPRRLSFRYEPDERLPDAYEQVLVDAIYGKKNLFTESNEVLASWRILQPILDAWSFGKGPLYTYAAGTSHLAIGPKP